MPPWVKRRIVWSPAARAELLALEDRGHQDLTDSAIQALKCYAESGAVGQCALAFFTRGVWRGHWRLKDPGLQNGWRILFRDAEARRTLFVERIRLREDAYEPRS